MSKTNVKYFKIKDYGDEILNEAMHSVIYSHINLENDMRTILEYINTGKAIPKSKDKPIEQIIFYLSKLLKLLNEISQKAVEDLRKEPINHDNIYIIMEATMEIYLLNQRT